MVDLTLSTDIVTVHTATVPRSRRPRSLTLVPPFHEGGEGEPMVLLHGFTDTCHAWTPLLPTLTRHHRVFAPTLPGHHGGEQFAPGEPMTIPGSLDRIERMLDERGIERAHLVGSSLGGWASLLLAERGRALSVVAVCPAGGWDHGSREERKVIRFFRTNDRLVRTSPRSLPTVAASRRLRAFALRDLMGHPERISRDDALTLFHGALGCAVIHDALAIASSSDAFGTVRHAGVPTRVLYGTADRVITWPRHYTRMQRLLPEAEYVALEGLGHLPMWEDADLVARRILEVTAPERIAA